MEFIRVRRVILPLATLFLLAGCKEPEIQGTWNGSDSSFKPSAVAAVFSGAQKELNGQTVSVSGLSGPVGNKVFQVTLGSNDTSKEWVETVLAKTQEYQASFNTTVTVNFIDVNDVTDEDEKSILETLKQVGMGQQGSYSSQIDWVRTEVQVYTQTLNIPGVKKPYGDNTVYCQIKVPLTQDLPDLVIKGPLPRMTEADIPDDKRSQMSKEQLAQLIETENDSRESLNIGLRMMEPDYPNKITFSDEFMRHIPYSRRASEAYYLETDSITIGFGAIPDAKSGPISGNDLGGLLHSQCESIVKEKMPELDAKRANSLGYKNIGKLTLNPEWKPVI